MNYKFIRSIGTILFFIGVTSKNHIAEVNLLSGAYVFVAVAYYLLYKETNND